MQSKVQKKYDAVPTLYRTYIAAEAVAARINRHRGARVAGASKHYPSDLWCVTIYKEDTRDFVGVL